LYKTKEEYSYLFPYTSDIWGKVL